MEKCLICDLEFDNVRKLCKHLKDVHEEEQSNYCLKYKNINNKCKICGNDTKFINLVKGFRIYCSASCRNKDDDYQDKIKKTNVIKYGSESHFHNDEIREKIKQSNLKKYGTENAFQNSEVREIQKNTLLKRYGVDHQSKMTEVRKVLSEKAKKNYPLQLDKTIQTNIKRYGTEYAIASDEVKKKINENTLKNFFIKLIENKNILSRVEPLFSQKDYMGVDRKYLYKWKCKKCGMVFEDHLHSNIPRCRFCYPVLNGSSAMENEISDFCKTFNYNLIKNSKSIISPFELDIYIPDKKLAIEYNGLYWHSELNGNKDNNYHLNKTLLCKEKGIQLIHIFEDEWINKQDIIKSIITSKLGLIKNKIFARKCIIKEASYEDACVFLNNNHIQGEIYGSNVGLYFHDELVSILTVGIPRFNKQYKYEILRFCNKINTSVMGSFSRLLYYFINNNNPKSIITYADLRYSNGNLYDKNGFNLIHRSKPNFYYFLSQNCNIRYSRLQFQKHKLKNKLETFDPSLTEWQNMQLNGYDRIWDCGCNVYEYIL